MTAIRALALSVFMLLGCGCGTGLDDIRARYGLRPMDIELAEENQAQVLLGGKQESPVSAQIKLEKGSLRGQISLSGEGSLTYLKKSYRFDITGDPGPFPFSSFKLHAQSRDPSFLRTLLGYRVFKSLGLPTPEVEPVVLFLHGKLLGLYLLIERVNEDFYKRRGIEPLRIYRSKFSKSTFDASMLADPERGLKIQHGKFYAPEIQNLVRLANSPPSADTERLAAKLLDVDNAARFMAGDLFLLNCDSFYNNLFIYKEKKDDSLRFTPWDWEYTYKGLCTAQSLVKTSRLTETIYSLPSFRARIDALIQDLGQRLYPPPVVSGILNEDFARIEKAFRDDRYLGGFGLDPLAEKDTVFRIYSESL